MSIQFQPQINCVYFKPSLDRGLLCYPSLPTTCLSILKDDLTSSFIEQVKWLDNLTFQLSDPCIHLLLYPSSPLQGYYFLILIYNFLFMFSLFLSPLF